MRTGITICRRHGREAWEVLYGPDVPVGDQRTAAKKMFTAGHENDRFAEVQTWESGSGIRKQRVFVKPPKAKSE